jgi:hypothetical protein
LTENRARTVFLLAHTGRPAAVRSAELVVKGLLRSGLGVRVLVRAGPPEGRTEALEEVGERGLLRRVREGLNPRLEIEGVLLTMYDARTNLSAQVASEVRRHMNGTVYQTVVPRSVRLSEAPSHGLPIALYDPASRGADAYRDLAGEVVARG